MAPSAAAPTPDSSTALWTSPHLADRSLFGTDGVRGKVGDLLGAPLAMQIGFWTGVVLREAAGASGPVIVGQDSRNSGDMLGTALASGLTAAGVEVWHLGLCPTPAVAYLTHHSPAIGGVMISASHNPPCDNGLKVFAAQGTKLSKDLQQAIEAGVKGLRDLDAHIADYGRHSNRGDLTDRYRANILESLEEGLDLRGLKVVLDPAWGATARLAPQVFRDLGAEVICLHGEPNGDRINVGCGSTHLGPLQEAVRAHGADLGFAFDGDADRVLAVDHLGRPVDGDYILYLWGQDLRRQGRLPGDTVVATVMSNLGFERAWEASGGTFVRTAVGDQYVQAEMERLGAMLGGEQSGHILCRHHAFTGDGTLTAAHLAALTRTAGAPLAELVDASFTTYPQRLKNVRVEDRQKRLTWQDCDALTQAIAAAETAMGAQGRVLVRASGTEPLIRVMVEAESAEMVDHWTDHLATLAERYLA